MVGLSAEMLLEPIHLMIIYLRFSLFYFVCLCVC